MPHTMRYYLVRLSLGLDCSSLPSVQYITAQVYIYQMYIHDHSFGREVHPKPSGKAF